MNQENAQDYWLQVDTPHLRLVHEHVDHHAIMKSAPGLKNVKLWGNESGKAQCTCRSAGGGWLPAQGDAKFRGCRCWLLCGASATAGQGRTVQSDKRPEIVQLCTAV